MSYLGLGQGPRFDPGNTPIAAAQNFSNFLQNRQLNQQKVQQAQINNQYLPQQSQANINQTNSASALNTAQANSPSINPVASGNSLYQSFLNAKSPQEAAYWAAQLNKQTVAPANMMGIPAGPAAGPFNTNPGAYGSQVSPQQGQPQGNYGSGIPMQQSPQMPVYPQSGGGITPQNTNPNFTSPSGGSNGQVGTNVPGMSPVDPNQAPNSVSYNPMSMSRAPHQAVVNNGATSTIVSAPSDGALTNLQIRNQALAEQRVGAPYVLADPYQGNIIQRDISPFADLALSSFGDSSARNRLIQGDTAERLVTPVSGQGARVALAGNAGEGTMNSYEKNYDDNMTGPWAQSLLRFFEPGSIGVAGKKNALAVEQNSGIAANQESGIGNPIQVPTNQVISQGGNPTAIQPLPVTGYSNPSAPSSPSAQPGNQPLPPMPNFSNSDELRGWFKGLSPQQKLAYAPQLKGGN